MGFFATILLIFIAGVRQTGSQATELSMQGLEQAIFRGVTECYAINGYYPSSLAELCKMTGLSYDSEDFIIDYQFIGSNIMPDVTVIAKVKR